MKSTIRSYLRFVRQADRVTAKSHKHWVRETQLLRHFSGTKTGRSVSIGYIKWKQRCQNGIRDVKMEIMSSIRLGQSNYDSFTRFFKHFISERLVRSMHLSVINIRIGRADVRPFLVFVVLMKWNF